MDTADSSAALEAFEAGTEAPVSAPAQKHLADGHSALNHLDPGLLSESRPDPGPESRFDSQPTSLPLTAHLNWMLALVVSLLPQIFLAAAVSTAVGLVVGNGGWAAASGTTTALAAIPLLTRRRGRPTLSQKAAGGASDGASEEHEGVTVYFHNILCSNKQLDEVFEAAFTASVRPDLVAFIETSRRVRTALVDSPHFKDGGGPVRWRRLEAAYVRAGRGMVVATSLPDERVLSHGNVTLPSKRPCFYVVVSTGCGPLKVVFCHPAAPHSTRLHQERNKDLVALAQMAAESEVPVVLAGDFNLMATDPAYREFTRVGWHSIDPITPTWAHVKAGVARRLTRLTIDHVICSPGQVAFSDVTVGDATYGSDHHPIWVRLAPQASHDD